MNKGLFIILGAAAAYFLIRKNGNPSTANAYNDLAAKKLALVNYVNKGGDSTQTKTHFANVVYNFLNQAEIEALYTYFFSYVAKGIQLPSNSQLYYTIQEINANFVLFN